ncbi:hypothetical protein RQM59_00495 [Flavobacteriaceae bacterium S356]|uniref:OmpA-like domain-containing protein n=1 Tax=Asprobacillus argus TaxID=3076534 RepID=A0ABU3LAY3_9FLAO|nr:hypothetical protein [Flavobacteriaceae bacterium S356]
MKKIISLLFLLFTSPWIEAQNNYGILFPTDVQRSQKCRYFTQVFQQKPKEVRFGIKVENNQLFFEINDKKWFDQLFKKSGDGMAIDVVSKSRYACEISTVKKQQIRGTLLKPVFAKQLRKGLRPTKNKLYRVRVGSLPSGTEKDVLEFNILFLNNKTLCQYYWIYDLESYPWDLLDMGMYLDSLVYSRKKVMSTKDKFIMKYKTLTFTIPFEKNKSVYAAEDIKPLYDSLRLTDFNIKKINIRAYASVEGSLKRNVELQEQRANSIAAAMQSFQKPTIVTEINSSENWVEFLNDITGTSYEDLKALSKEQVKKKLVGTVSSALEPYLKRHRKAVITLQLDKKDKYKEMTVSTLTGLFSTAIAEDKIPEALEIQNSIFDKLKGKETPPDLLTQMSVPKQLKYVPILNKNSMFKFSRDDRFSLIVLNELLQLEKLAPKSKKVKYNITVAKFKLWRFNHQSVKEKDLKNQILSLKKHGITQSLIDRMLVNFHIIKAEKLMRQRNYKVKDVSVRYIQKNYKKFPLTNYDYLSLAQFFSFYSNVSAAVELLEEKARDITIDEDLLFYYLNLTLINKQLTQSSDYRTSMLNAINMNKERFCKIFNSIIDGGVTFQLLENEYLRKTYCENCSD